MKKKLIASIVVFIAGFIAAFILMGYYNSWQDTEGADAQTSDSTVRPVTAVPEHGPVPSITLEAFVDDLDGYNLHFVTENFTFTPGLIGEGSTPNTGYATVYINGMRQARVYNTWYHIGYDALVQGQNTIEVVLTTNDHTDWVVNDSPIQDAVILERTE